MGQALDTYAHARVAVSPCGLQRRDGSYVFYALRDEFAQYPASHAAYERAVRRENLLLAGVAIGAVILGTTLMDHTQADSADDGFGTTGRVVGYSVGGIVVVSTLIAGLIVNKRDVRNTVDTYNDELRSSLALTPRDTAQIDRSQVGGKPCF